MKKGYIAGLNGKTVEIYAHNLYEAKKLAFCELKPKKSELGLLWVMLAEKDGEPVTHSPATL